MNRKARIIGAIAAFIILIVLLITTLAKQNRADLTRKIFGTLDEFSCFDNYETEELPDIEELTDGLNIKDRRCFTVSFEGYDFNVYAYVFSTAEEAHAFAERFGQGEYSCGMSSVVDYINRAMLVTGSGNRSTEFMKYLNEHLTETVG